jgi:hypothetical protein
MRFEELKDILAELAAEQLEKVAVWHRSEPDMPEPADKEPCEDLLRELVISEHLVNFRLWHVEDEARRTDVDDAAIAGCKRRIDRLNQQRNDLIEQVDACIVGLVAGELPPDASDRRNTETLGSALDRLSINALKIYHMGEEAGRADAGREHVKKCEQKVRVLREQRDDLLTAVLQLIDEYAAGAKSPRVYYQFKMYNDPALNPKLYGCRAEQGSE